MSEHQTGHDSAGVPWHGRALSPQPFAGDAGEPDPALAAALAEYAAGRGDLTTVGDALASARVFVPIVAVLDAVLDAGEADDAQTMRTVGDAGADMALITLTGQDGTRALPVFSSVAALARWDPAARPVPVEAARAAQAAVAEGCDVVLLDLGSSASAVVPRPVVWAIGQGRPWAPPSRDPEIVAEVRRVCVQVPDVVTVETEDDAGAELCVVLGLRPGLDRAALERAAAAAQVGLRGSRLVSERAGAIRLRIVPA